MKIVLTGGHSGIGLALSNTLLSEGHELALIVRNEERAEQVKESLINATNVTFFYADLAKQSDVLNVAKKITEQWPQIDGLFNNAGILLDKNYYSEQQNEMHLEVNTLAPYVLTQALVKNLQSSHEAFVINTSTGGLHNQKSIKLEQLIQPKTFVKLMGAYYQSKLATVVVMSELSEHHPQLRILNVDPGALKTKMTGDKDAMPWIMRIIRALFFQAPDKGAQKLYNGAFSAEFKTLTNAYITGNKVQPLKLKINKDDVQALLAGVN
ncbi:MAG: SDR family NAD(P)-dependent oxidoreductase [Pseudomonadota bacterium]